MSFRKANIQDESGVAMITVIVISAALMVLATGMFFVSSRENTITQADYAGSQAFYFAEGGIENVLDVLNYVATEYQLTQLRADQSSDGHGYLMDPTASNRQNPTNPLEMKVGDTTFTVWVDEVDENGDHCTGCGLNVQSMEPAYLLITAEGQSHEGYRKLQQLVKLEASAFPMTLFINGNVTANGNVALTNQSMYVLGDFSGREKLTVSGYDIPDGGYAGVFATGTIYKKSNGAPSQIYKEDGSQNSRYWSSNFIHDRDKNGPAGSTPPTAPYTVEELNNKYETAGLTTSQLLMLKSMAKTSGYYSNPVSGNITLQQSDLPVRSGNIVVYIEYSGGTAETNEVNLKFDWPHSPYTDGKAMVVIKNGSVKMTGSQMGNFHGSVYCPDGPARVDGTGSGSYTGFLFAKGLDDIGNFNFNMTSSFFNDPPFFSWYVVRLTAWTDVDR